MFRDPEDQDSTTPFVVNWELEVRAGFTPEQELDVVLRLEEDYLDPDDSDERTAKMSAEVSAESVRILRDARAAEATWTELTANDRLTTAFAALDKLDIFARERSGTTLQDGWGYVGLEADRRHHGAVFFHQEDVFDALHGQSMFLAFGGTKAHASSGSDDVRVAEITLDVLARHGLAPSWTGRAEDRIEIAPFAWQRRRWSRAPRTVETKAAPWKRTAQQLALFAVADDARRRYEQRLIARRTSYAFDDILSRRMRGAWLSLGGERGQFGDTADPLVFVPSGNEVVVAPVDARRNLPPHESAALRARALEVRGSKRPWWKLW